MSMVVQVKSGGKGVALGEQMIYYYHATFICHAKFAHPILCNRHSGGRKTVQFCSFQGCPNQAKKSGLCNIHFDTSQDAVQA